MAFNIAISGLSAAQTDLEVIAHNIANASTAGFKEGRAEFADLYANTFSDISANAAGRGVYVTRVAQQFSQGTIEFTGNNLDLGVTGEGFFVTASEDNEIFYTRAGQFSVDRDGYVVNFADRRLKVLPVTSADPFDIPNLQFSSSGEPGSLADLRLPASLGAPSATTAIETDINLDSTETVPTTAITWPLVVPVAPATQTMPDPDSYNHSTSTTVYDSLGQAHTANFYYVKTAANTWDAYVAVERGDGYFESAGTQTLTFDTDGTLLTPATGLFTINAPTVNGSTTTLDMEVDVGDMTQYGSSFDVNNLVQDGYTTGRLSGIDIGKDGVVFARYTNGQSQALGKIALANFNNPQGLNKVGDTAWQGTYAAGDVRIGAPLSSDFGSIQAGANEASNTDLATQLVKLIIAQRNYQANAQVITTSNNITQAILNI